MEEDSPLPLNLHLHHLAYLREVERSGTFTTAARRLHISQSALSQALAEFERRLGVPLFERDGRRRALTEAGREAARFAAEVLGRATELRAWVDARRAGGSGSLVIGMIDAASLYVLPSAVAAFRAGHPGVELRVVVDTTEALLERLQRFEVDLAVVVGPVASTFHTVEVAREPLRLYGPPGEAAPEPDSEWILYPGGSHTRAVIDAALAARRILPRVTLESSNPQVLRQLVALGFGWSVLPERVAEDGQPPLRSVSEVLGERTLLGVRRPGAPPDMRAEAFLTLAVAAGSAARGDV